MSYKIVGIGELLWDFLPQGKQLGGAPCNFAFHACQVGLDSYVVSRIGDDMDGEEICQVLDQLELNRSFVQTTSRFPTGAVTVKLDQEGIPEYTIHENVAWDHIVWGKNLEILAGDIHAVCFGSLAQRNQISKDTIWKFLEATRKECLRIFDINLRQSFYTREIIFRSLEYANILKLNEDELPVVGAYLGFEGKDEDLLNQILDKFQLQLIAYTKGGLGSLLITRHEKSFCEVPVIEVVDTVGAGDSFTAILVAGVLNGLPLKKTHKAATEIAAYVCSQHGATPKLSEKLINQIKIQ
jgi:fructokinase